MSTTEVVLTTLDEAFLNLDDTVTWSIQFEVGVSGSLDVDRLRAAVRAAAARHPMARARLTPRPQRGERRRYWAIADEPDFVRCNVVACPTDDDLRRLRAEVYDVAPRLAQSPLFEVTLAQRPGGDLLMVNLHHVAFDGMSAVRLLTSIARGYAGVPDPVGGPEDLAAARDLRAIAGSGGVRRLLQRTAGLASDGLARRRGVARLAADGDGAADGASRQFGYVTRRLDRGQTARVVAAKPPGCTVNDVLLAQLLASIRAWNAEHGAEGPERVTAMMPVNMRPSAWSSEVLSNFASYLTIALEPAVADTFDATTAAIADQTRRYKEQDAAGWVVDLLEPGNLLPIALKRRLQWALPLVQGAFLETAVLSNLGRAELPGFGDAGEVTEVWFSPPCCAPLALAVGAATIDGQLMLTLRHLTGVLSPEAAERFAESYLERIVRASAG